MEIYELLKKDHELVKTLLNKLEIHFDPAILEELKTELWAHSKAEEEIFYTPLKAKIGNLELLVDGAHEEHKLAMKMLEKAGEVERSEERLAIISTAKKSIEAHIFKEETDFFKLAQKHFSPAEAKAMAETMSQIKEKLKQAA